MVKICEICNGIIRGSGRKYCKSCRHSHEAIERGKSNSIEYMYSQLRQIRLKEINRKFIIAIIIILILFISAFYINRFINRNNCFYYMNECISLDDIREMESQCTAENLDLIIFLENFQMESACYRGKIDDRRIKYFLETDITDCENIRGIPIIKVDPSFRNRDEVDCIELN